MKRNVAIVALINDAGEIFMVRTHRFPEKWQPVGGGLEETDTDPVSALLREVEEEVGVKLDINAVEHVTTVPFDFGEGEVYCYSYRLEGTSNMMVNDTEILESRWVSLEEALDLPMYPATESFIKKARTELG